MRSEVPFQVVIGMEIVGVERLFKVCILVSLGILS